MVHMLTPFPPLCPLCSSRLGSRIVLSKDMDNILVALSDIAPWRSL